MARAGSDPAGPPSRLAKGSASLGDGACHLCMPGSFSTAPALNGWGVVPGKGVGGKAAKGSKIGCTCGCSLSCARPRAPRAPPKFPAVASEVGAPQCWQIFACAESTPPQCLHMVTRDPHFRVFCLTAPQEPTLHTNAGWRLCLRYA